MSNTLNNFKIEFKLNLNNYFHKLFNTYILNIKQFMKRNNNY